MRGQARALTALVVEDEVLVRCDIVFTDIQLAGAKNGWDVAEEARKGQPGVHVIYTSSKTMDSSRRVERSLFIAKPYAADDVVAACQKFVDGRLPPRP